MFVRASGAGGQNVNKTATKAQLHWNVWRSSAFNDDEKRRIAIALAKRMNNDGDVVISASEERSQSQNRVTALERLDKMIAFALKPTKKRIATKPTRASKTRRIQTKKLHSRKKQLRRVTSE